MFLYRPPCPHVSIVADKYDICTGETITFLAASWYTNYVYYQWFINGVPVIGEIDYRMISSSINNKDVIYCMITGTTCRDIKSNEIEITVRQKNVPTIVIDWVNLNQPETTGYICEGDEILFNSVITWGGSSPTYQWYSDGGSSNWNPIIGETNPYMRYTPIIIDLPYEKIACYMTSNSTCVNPSGVTSNIITLDVTPKAPVSVSINVNPSGITCDGTPVTYTAIGVNGGTVPTYQWYVNYISGNTIDYQMSAFTYTPSNNDLIGVVYRSNLRCIKDNPAIAYKISQVIDISPVLVEIESSPKSTGTFPETTCSVAIGDTIIISVTNVETVCGHEVYRWLIDTGTTWVAGGNSQVLILTAAAYLDRARINCEVTSDCPCSTNNPAYSNTIDIEIVSVSPRSISIASNVTICTGSTATFNAVSTGYAVPHYQWKLNGVNDGTNSSSYSTNNFPLTTTPITCDCREETGTPYLTTSNTIYAYVQSKCTPSVTIICSPNPSCDGQNVNFSISSSLCLGSTPTFQWQAQENVDPWYDIIDATNFSYSSNNLKNVDKIRLIVTTSLTCVTTSTAISNELSITVIPNVVPSVSITADNTCVTTLTAVTFTAVPTNGGDSPTYEWFISPSSTPSYTGGHVWVASLTYGAKTIICKMISNAVCSSLSQVFDIIYLPNCLCENCYDGYIAIPDGRCSKVVNTAPLGVSTTSIGVSSSYGYYSDHGTLFFDSTYNTDGTCPPNHYTGLTTGIWSSYGSSSLGPMNKCGIWTALASPTPQDIQFSYCFTISTSKQYYIGIGCDNYAIIKIDGNLIIQQNTTTLNAQFGLDETVTFKYWFVYPIYILAGFHVIELIGHNQQSQYGLGFEIYDATLSQMMEATDYDTFYNTYTIWSTKTKIGTQIQITSGNGYHCENGYTLVMCNGDPYCTKTLYLDCGQTP